MPRGYRYTPPPGGSGPPYQGVPGGVKIGPFWGSPGGSKIPPFWTPWEGGPGGPPGGAPGPPGGARRAPGAEIWSPRNHPFLSEKPTSVPTGRVIKYPRKCTPGAPGAPRGPPGGPPAQGGLGPPPGGPPRGSRGPPIYPR